MSAPPGEDPSPDELAARIAAFTRWSLAATADEAEQHDGGLVVTTRSLPAVWTLNQVRLVGPTTAEEVRRFADRFQADLAFRHVVVEGGIAPSVVDELGAGWTVAHEVVLAMPARVDRDVDTARVVELREDQMLTLMRAWLLEERKGIEPDELDQVLAYNRREGALFDETRLGVVDDGVPLAVTKLRVHEDVAWLEDVYTVPTARALGFSRACLAEAVTRAWDQQPSFAFIVADDDDWPKDFYGRAGFTAVARNDTLHRAAS